MMKRRPPPRPPEINMTSLMDLTFLLLITFMITFPLVEQGIPVSLPQGKAKELDDRAKASVTVDREGKIYVDGVETALDMVAPLVKSRLEEQSDLTVLVRADESIAYGKVVGVLRELHEANVTRMALVTTPPAGGGGSP